MDRGEIARAYHQLTSARSVSEWRAPVEDPQRQRGRAELKRGIPTAVTAGVMVCPSLGLAAVIEPIVPPGAYRNRFARR